MSGPRFTYANVASTLALVLAMGVGTSYAATKLPENSVTAKQIKKNAVRSAEIKDRSVAAGDLSDGAVTSAKIADSAVTSAKIANGGVGLADLDGPATAALSKPRAYGVFTSAGVLVPSRSSGATVTKVPATTGQYCVNPTGFDPATTTIVAAPGYGGNGLFHIVALADGASASQSVTCPNGFFLRTFNEDASTFEAENIEVSFIIP